MPHRKKSPVLTSSPASRAPRARTKARLARQIARGALLAVGFTALQYFGEDFAVDGRLFDHRVVDSLQAPLTHYHE